MPLLPFSALTPGFKDRVGLAGGAGCLVLAKGDVVSYGGLVSEWTTADWLACAAVLESLTGFVGTWDLVALVHTLPPSLRAALRWPTVYDLEVESVLAGGEKSGPAVALDNIVYRAAAALHLRSTRMVESALVSQVLLALNRSTYVLDPAKLNETAVHQKKIVAQHLPVVFEGLSHRSLGKLREDPELIRERSQHPAWLAAFTAARRADTVALRATALENSLLSAERVGPWQLIRPAWRFHKRWTFAASGPAVPVLPKELRVAFPAEAGKVWIGLTLDHPRVRWLMAEGSDEWVSRRDALSAADPVAAADPVVDFAQAQGFASPVLYEVVLGQRTGDADISPQVTEATNELYTWVLRHVGDWERFGTAAPMIWVQGAVYFQIPREADLLAFMRHLHATLVTTPRVARWREAGVLCWTVSAGPDWGHLRVLNKDAVFWPTELGMV